MLRNGFKANLTEQPMKYPVAPRYAAIQWGDNWGDRIINAVETQQKLGKYRK